MEVEHGLLEYHIHLQRGDDPLPCLLKGGYTPHSAHLKAIYAPPTSKAHLVSTGPDLSPAQLGPESEQRNCTRTKSGTASQLTYFCPFWISQYPLLSHSRIPSL